MHVCMSECKFVMCIFVLTYANLCMNANFIYMYICRYVCVHAGMYAYMNVCVSISLYECRYVFV